MLEDLAQNDTGKYNKNTIHESDTQDNTATTQHKKTTHMTVQRQYNTRKRYTGQYSNNAAQENDTHDNTTTR